jgi:hypothetical protein
VYRGRGTGKSVNPFSTPYQAMWNEHRAAAQWNEYWRQQNMRNYYASLQRQSQQQAAARKLPAGPTKEDAAAMSEEPTRLVPIQNARELSITENASAKQSIPNLPPTAGGAGAEDKTSTQFTQGSLQAPGDASALDECPHCGKHSGKKAKCTHCGHSSSFGGKLSSMLHPMTFAPKRGLKSGAKCLSCGSSDCENGHCSKSHRASGKCTTGDCSTGACPTGTCGAETVVGGCATCDSGPIFISDSAIIVPDGAEIIVSPNESGELVPSLPAGPVLQPGSPTQSIPTAPAKGVTIEPSNEPTVIIPNTTTSALPPGAVIITSPPTASSTTRPVLGQRLAEASGRSQGISVSTPAEAVVVGQPSKTSELVSVPVVSGAGPVIISPAAPPVATAAKAASKPSVSAARAAETTKVESKPAKPSKPSPRTASNQTASTRAAEKTDRPATVQAPVRKSSVTPLTRATTPTSARPSAVAAKPSPKTGSGLRKLEAPKVSAAPNESPRTQTQASTKNGASTRKLEAVARTVKEPKKLETPKDDEQSEEAEPAAVAEAPKRVLGPKPLSPRTPPRNYSPTQASMKNQLNRSTASIAAAPKKAPNTGLKPLIKDSKLGSLIFPAAAPERVDQRVGNADYQSNPDEDEQPKKIKRAANGAKTSARTTLRPINSKPSTGEDDEAPTPSR